MTDTREVVLTEDEIKEAAKKYAVEWLPSNTVGGTFEAGARFARSFYEQREALWREYVGVLNRKLNAQLHGKAYTNLMKRYLELRAALGLEG